MPRRKDNQEFFSVSQTLAANLENDFSKLLKSYSGDEAQVAGLVSLVISKYREKHRFYHNLSHIKALLLIAEQFKAKFDDFESVILAIWFHDVIYEPKASNNESESAKLAVAELTKLNVPEALIKEVEQMILATFHHDGRELDDDGRLFLDLDLSILGAKEEIYKKYARAVRQEYSFVPESLFRHRRGLILQNLLHRTILYYTDELRELFEEPARRNIANEIKALS